MTVKREKDCLVADVHGMRVNDARFRLETLIESCGADVRAIRVIHGCNNGQALRDMVRTLQSPRLLKVRPDFFNDGQTILELKVKR